MAHPPAATTNPAVPGSRGHGSPSARWAVFALVAASVLVFASITVPMVVGWNVHEDGVHPLSAVWDPRVGPGTLPAVVIAVLAVAWGPGLAERLRWRVLLPLSYVASVAWLVALATVDGRTGLAGVLGKSSEYLPTARKTTDVHAMLHHFISRIPLSAAPDNWPIHVAGHPPGALLFFVALVRVDLGGDLAAGLTVVAVAAATPAAVLLTLRRLGASASARAVAPFLVIGPAAIWTAVSADAVFASCAAWGVCLFTCSLTAATPRARAGWGLAAGLLFGYLPYLSYGLVLFAVLALAVAVATHSWRPLGWSVMGFLAVVAAFTTAGFSWWRAYPVLQHRYWDGAAHLRPGAYWTWADLALLVISAGPALAVGGTAAIEHGAAVVRQRRSPQRAGNDQSRAVLLLSGGAAVAILVADLSQMSRAEVERIWLPFVPWLLLTVAFLPQTWRRRALAGQAVTALAVQSLLFTRW